MEHKKTTVRDSLARVLSIQAVGFFTGIGLFLLLLLLPAFPPFQTMLMHKYPALSPQDIQLAAAAMQKVFAVLILMICWWVTEAVAIPVTALVPVLCIPFLHLYKVTPKALLVVKPEDILATYADPIVFLFMGSFFLAMALTAHRLDRYFTFWTLSIKAFAGSPQKLVLGMILATGVLSMWMNNTATAAMMIPIALGIINSIDDPEIAHSQAGRNFAAVLVLGIAWAASIGGVGTIVGTAPNGIAISVLKQQGVANVTFAEWLVFGLPISLILLFASWWYLSKKLPYNSLSFTDIAADIHEQKRLLGPLTGSQKKVLCIFGMTALLWIGIPIAQNLAPPAIAAWFDPFDVWVVAILASMALFLIPDNFHERRFLLSWNEAQTIDWGTLILFGGGLAIAKMMFVSGGAEFLAYEAGSLLGSSSTIVLVIVLVPTMIFLSEFTSNTAITSMMMPIVLSIAIGAHANAKVIGLAVALAASLAFMMPVGTPPNAIAYGTGKIPLPQMLRTGFAMNLMSWVVICVVILLVYTLF